MPRAIPLPAVCVLVDSLKHWKIINFLLDFQQSHSKAILIWGFSSIARGILAVNLYVEAVKRELSWWNKDRWLFRKSSLIYGIYSIDSIGKEQKWWSGTLSLFRRVISAIIYQDLNRVDNGSAGTDDPWAMGKSDLFLRYATVISQRKKLKHNLILLSFLCFATILDAIRSEISSVYQH